MSGENTIQQFVNDELGANLRIVDRNGQPWFVNIDVCAACGISDARQAADALDEDERYIIPVIDSLGRAQNTYVISEAGLYSLILRSRKPEAKIFKRWVTHEVLPSIRKHGAYATDSVLEKIAHDPGSIIALAEAIIQERDRRQLAEERLEVFKPKMPFGIPSEVNGRPRTKPIAGYFRTTKTTTTVTEVTEHQRRLFDFEGDFDTEFIAR